MESADRDQVIARLESMLRELWDELPAGAKVNRETSLLELGIDSLTLVLLLDRTEREFRPKWDSGDPPGASCSLGSLADLVVRGTADAGEK